MPADAAQVSSTAEADVEPVASGLAAAVPDSTVAAAPDAPPSSESIADPDSFQHMSKEDFIKFSIQCRALAREACAKAKVLVARYLETGDLADLFPEHNSSAEERALCPSPKTRPLAITLGAIDAERVELALDVTEDEIGSLARVHSIT